MKPSRGMITGELSWAWVALACAWNGSGLWPFEGSYLYTILARRNMDELWCIAVGVPALALMFVSGREWIVHCFTDTFERWNVFQLEQSVRMRAWLCLALAFSWIYVVYVMALVQSRPGQITPVAGGGAIFMLAFWLENRRVQRAVKKTSGLALAT